MLAVLRNTTSPAVVRVRYSGCRGEGPLGTDTDANETSMHASSRSNGFSQRLKRTLERPTVNPFSEYIAFDLSGALSIMYNIIRACVRARVAG